MFWRTYELRNVWLSLSNTSITSHRYMYVCEFFENSQDLLSTNFIDMIWHIYSYHRLLVLNFQNLSHYVHIFEAPLKNLTLANKVTCYFIVVEGENNSPGRMLNVKLFSLCRNKALGIVSYELCLLSSTHLSFNKIWDWSGLHFLSCFVLICSNT